MTVTAEVVSPLTESERAELAELEAVIEADLQTFVEVGRALMTVRDLGLYRDCDPPTFAAYLDQRWGTSIRYAQNIMQSARISLACQGAQLRAPGSEWVARQLVPFLSPDGDTSGVVEVWRRVIDRLGDQRPTATNVREAMIAEGLAPDDRYRSTSGGQLNPRDLIGKCGDRLIAAETRLARFVERELKRAPTKGVQEKAAEYAERCRRMAVVYDAIAQGERPELGE